MRFLTILFSASLVVVAPTSLARELSSDRVTFRTDAPQSAYGPGDAVTRSETLTLPLPFEGNVPFDLVTGSDRTPNPEWAAQVAKREADVAAYEAAKALYESVRRERGRINDFLEFTYPGLLASYETRLAAWRVCERQPFASCGRRPRRPARPSLPPLPPAPGRAPPPVTAEQFIDTRHGVAGEVYVKGIARLELSAGASLGHIEPELTYEIRIDGPETVTPGAYFELETTSALVSGRIDGATPGFRVTLDQIMRIDAARIQLMECRLGVGCRETPVYEFNQLGVEKRTRIVEITPVEASFFAEPVPERFVRAGAPVLRLEAVVSVELGGEDVQNPFSLSINGIGVPPNVVVPALSVDVATIFGQAPYVEVPGAREGDRIAGEERSEYLGFRLDVDAIAQLPGGASFGNAFVSLSADLWDVEAGPKLDVFQSFELDPTLTIMLEFEPAVMVEGRGMADRLEATGDMPRIAVAGSTTVTPVYSVAADVTSQMGYQAAGAIQAELIKGAVSFGPATVALGPLAPIRAEWAPETGRIPLFDRRFPLGGLREMRGEPFQIGG